MTKIVINTCYGRFSLSMRCVEFMAERGHDEAKEELAEEEFFGYSCDKDRSNPTLVEAIETLGTKVASGKSAQLIIVEIPDDVDWEIEDYDGQEHVAEKHRTWG